MIAELEEEAKYENKKNVDEHIKRNYILLVNYRFHFAARDQSEQKIFEIDAIYEAKYASDIKLTDKIFEIFKNVEVKFHLWPYFREFLVDATVRMGFPPPRLPLFRVKYGITPKNNQN